LVALGLGVASLVGGCSQTIPIWEMSDVPKVSGDLLNKSQQVKAVEDLKQTAEAERIKAIATIEKSAPSKPK
jgi:hypothetical protein